MKLKKSSSYCAFVFKLRGKGIGVYDRREWKDSTEINGGMKRGRLNKAKRTGGNRLCSGERR